VTAVVSREPASKAGLALAYGVGIVGSIDEMLAKRKPDFVVTSVPGKANPDAIRELVSRGLPVLSETPPATTVAEMADLCHLVKAGAKLQVAEQYHLQPV
jgi:predicted dehydrogenase